MNPFLLILALIPLVSTAGLVFILIMIIVEKGPQKDIVAGVIIFSFILIYLIRVFAKLLRKDENMVTQPPLGEWDKLPHSFDRAFSNAAIFATYLVLFFGAVLLFGFQVRNVVGIVCAVVAIALNILSVQRIRDDRLAFFASDGDKAGIVRFIKKVLVPDRTHWPLRIKTILLFLLVFVVPGVAVGGKDFLSGMDYVCIYYLIISFSFWAVIRFYPKESIVENNDSLSDELGKQP